MLSFHGATLPRGQQRTWPHILSWEAVLGEESYTYRRGAPTPEHNVTLCFTRNVAGSMDYTPTTFLLPGRGFKRTTTDGHEMALAVMFESGWQNIGASPEGVAQTKAKDFLKNLPAAWDDIHFIDGYPDEYCIMARRKGDDWYLAGINSSPAREVAINLDFLKEGTYKIIFYTDDVNGEVITVNRQLNTEESMKVKMIENGGFGLMVPDSFSE
jgi:alpha-glucosidase